MSQIYSLAEKISSYINSIVWGAPMIILIFSVGVYFTFKLKFFQVLKFKLWINETFLAIFKNKNVRKTEDKKAITQFQSMATVLAATIGTGNIAGVATAIAIGGPGAIFWMWISAVFSMMTSYAENLLGIFYRKKNSNNEWIGGPMHYIEQGLKSRKNTKKFARPLAISFAIFCVFASFGIGNMTQSNAISSAVLTNLHMPNEVTALILMILASIVLLGGIKRIGAVTEKLVPFMAGFYILATLIIFFYNYNQIPHVFSSIFSNAFSLESFGGGVSGTIMSKCINLGFKRGIFSNEAGLGSSVLVSTSCDVKEPCKQAMWGIFQVFCDTLIVCTLTSFVLLSTTSNLPNFEYALENVTTDKQYFSISEDENSQNFLMDNHPMSALKLDKSGETYTVKTSDNQSFDVIISNENEKTYTNIMSIQGIHVNENGKQSIGEINSVLIESVEGVNLVIFAFSQVFGSFAGLFLTLAIILFAFSTVIGWSFYGVTAIRYLLGEKGAKLYKIIFILIIYVGANMKLNLVWEISDTLNALMAIPNLIGILLLSDKVVKITQNFLDRRSGKKTAPLFSADEKIQSENEFWYYENKK